MMRLLSILILLLASTVQAQEVIDCCRNLDPSTLACYELNKVSHTTTLSLSEDGTMYKEITGTLNGVESFCGCSKPYKSCGLGIEPTNLRLILAEGEQQ